MTISGIPLHPLIVHLAVVAVPVAALAAILITLVPKMAQRWALPTAIAAVIGAVAAAVASSTGEALAELKGMDEHAEPLMEHAQYGEGAVMCAMILAGLLVVYWLSVFKPQWFKVKALVIVLRIIIILAAIAAFGSIFLAGHEGAALVWLED